MVKITGLQRDLRLVPFREPVPSEPSHRLRQAMRRGQLGWCGLEYRAGSHRRQHGKLRTGTGPCHARIRRNWGRVELCRVRPRMRRFQGTSTTSLEGELRRIRTQVNGEWLQVTAAFETQREENR